MLPLHFCSIQLLHIRLSDCILEMNYFVHGLILTFFLADDVFTRDRLALQRYRQHDLKGRKGKGSIKVQHLLQIEVTPTTWYSHFHFATNFTKRLEHVMLYFALHVIN